MSRAESVDAEEGEAVGGDLGIDVTVTLDFGVVADLAEEAVGDTGRAAGATGDLEGAALVDVDVEDAGGTQGDRLQIVDLVVVEAGDQTETVTERAGDQAGTGRGADQGEPGQIERNRPGGRALAEHDIDAEVLHRRIQDLPRPGEGGGGSRR